MLDRTTILEFATREVESKDLTLKKELLKDAWQLINLLNRPNTSLGVAFTIKEELAELETELNAIFI